MPRAPFRASVAVMALGTMAIASCDPVHDSAVAALGDETPGVRQGPLHRAGQPCGTCHDGTVGNPRSFSVAGTIYVDEHDTTPAVDATVTLTSANGASYAATTNAAGNFYVEPAQFTPQYPMAVLVSYGAAFVRMSTLVGREGSCATCHHEPAGPTSAGHVFVPADGVTP